MKKLTALFAFIVLTVYFSNTVYANNQFMVLQENDMPYDFLSRRTEAQLDELYKLCDTEKYSYDSSEIYEQEGTTAFETAVFVNRSESENYIEDICLLVFYQSEDASFLKQREGDVSVLWDTDILTSTGEFIVNCYSGSKEYYHAERLSEAKQGIVGYTIELNGNDLSGIAAIKMVSTVYPSEFDTNLADMFDIEYTENSNCTVIMMILCILAVVFPLQ